MKKDNAQWNSFHQQLIIIILAKDVEGERFYASIVCQVDISYENNLIVTWVNNICFTHLITQLA